MSYYHLDYEFQEALLDKEFQRMKEALVGRVDDYEDQAAKLDKQHDKAREKLFKRLLKESGAQNKYNADGSRK